MTPDPLSEKYYGISPYAFCNNSPMVFIDLDGRIPRLYIQKSGFGHAFVSVWDGNETIIYTYGRYGALQEILGMTSGKFTPVGEGVLKKYTGEDAMQYLNEVYDKKSFEIFEINANIDNEIANYFNVLFNNGTRPSAKNKDNPNAKVIDTYHLLKNNCVTTTIRGINSSKQLIESQAISPFGLFKELNKNQDKSSTYQRVENPEAYLKSILNEYYENAY